MRAHKKKERVECTMQLPAELWLAVGMRLRAQPHAVFRLMMASKSANAAIRGAPAGWWGELLRGATAHQRELRYSRYAKQLGALAALCGNSASVLRAVFAPRCYGCGARRGHRLILPHAVRACGDCLRTRVISNVALLAQFGVHFGDFVEAYRSEGGLLVVQERAVVLLWRPHVERFVRLGFALEQERRVASRKLWAALQRAHQQRAARRRRLLLVAAFDGGAAYCSYLHSNNNPPQRHHASGMVPLGAGANPQRVLALLHQGTKKRAVSAARNRI